MSRSQRHHTSIWLNDGSVWSLETFQGICDFSLLSGIIHWAQK